MLNAGLFNVAPSFHRWRHRRLYNVAAGPALQAGRDGVADQGEGQHRRLRRPRQGPRVVGVRERERDEDDNNQWSCDMHIIIVIWKIIIHVRVPWSKARE